MSIGDQIDKEKMRKFMLDEPDCIGVAGNNPERGFCAKCGYNQLVEYIESFTVCWKCGFPIKEIKQDN